MHENTIYRLGDLKTCISVKNRDSKFSRYPYCLLFYCSTRNAKKGIAQRRLPINIFKGVTFLRSFGFVKGTYLQVVINFGVNNIFLRFQFGRIKKKLKQDTRGKVYKLHFLLFYSFAWKLCKKKEIQFFGRRLDVDAPSTTYGIGTSSSNYWKLRVIKSTPEITAT